ncbi:MAG TPA: CapA family protein [Acidothermaceae bacterium]|nr:CapA family protein [Acidothermaceae bacterium]
MPTRLAKGLPVMRHRGRRALLVAAAGVALVSGCRAHGSSGAQPPIATTVTSSPSVPSSSASPTSSAAPTAPSTSANVTTRPVVTIVAVGDVALGNTPRLPAAPSNYLAPMRAVLSAPIVFGNLEGALTNALSSKCPRPTPTPTATPTATPSVNPPVSPPLSPTPSPTPKPPTCFAFRMPTSYASVLRGAGFSVLNSANNHSHDFGARGVADTSAALRAVGIAQSGLPGQTATVNAGGVRVAFVGFAPYATTNNLLDDVRARQMIATAKQSADLVVVYMHTGAEGADAAHVAGGEERYLGEDRGNPRAFAHAAIDAGADLVVASGPHVLRGMEYYRGHLVAYSLGDFVGYGNFSTTGTLALTGALRVGLDRAGHPAVAQFTSLRLDASGRPAVDPTARAAGFVNELSVADFGASAAVIAPSGQVNPRPSGQ